MFTVMIFIIAAPILLIELFYTIISGTIEYKGKGDDEKPKSLYEIRTETNREESKRIDYWGTDDEWNNKWGKL